MPGASELNFSVHGEDDFSGTARALAEVETTLPDDFKRVIRENAEKLVAEARAKVLSEPVHGLKHTGLRAEIAAGVGLEDIPDGAHISTSMPQSDEAALPRGFDEPIRGWRHPVFGHRDRWVVQHSSFSWFLDTMKDGQEPIERDLHDVLEEVANKIGRRS